jgi:hypothetical protein
VPNWIYLVFNTLFHLGLALWIGGAIALGALTAPALFSFLPRPQAGAIFGSILRRFGMLRVVALGMIITGAGAKFLLWETHAVSPWLAIRWTAIALLGCALVYEIVTVNRLNAMGILLGPGVPADDSRRETFKALHRRAAAVMKASVMAAFVALFFS